jgi:hypothetical protein
VIRARTVLGFVAASVAAAVFMALEARLAWDPAPGATARLREFLEFVAVATPVAAALALIAAMPLYYVSLRSGRPRLWHAAAAGAVTPTLGLALLGDLGAPEPAMAIAGTAAGVVFWCIARPDLAMDE